MKKLTLSILAVVFLTAWCGMNGLAVAKPVPKAPPTKPPFQCAQCKPGVMCPDFCIAGRL